MKGDQNWSIPTESFYFHGKAFLYKNVTTSFFNQLYKLCVSGQNFVQITGFNFDILFIKTFCLQLTKLF